MCIDIARARRDTPGCEHLIHLDNAGAALPPRPVLDAVIGHLELEARIGGDEAADRQDAAALGYQGPECGDRVRGGAVALGRGARR